MTMQSEERKTGNTRHFEPLRAELINTFGDNKECNPAPKAVYSSRKGPAGPMGVADEEAAEGDEQPQATPSTADSEPKSENKKKKKCMSKLI